MSRIADLQETGSNSGEDLRRVDIMGDNAGIETRTSVLDTSESHNEQGRPSI